MKRWFDTILLLLIFLFSVERLREASIADHNTRLIMDILKGDLEKDYAIRKENRERISEILLLLQQHREETKP